MAATGWRPKHAAAQNLIANKVKDRRQLKATFDTIEDLDAFEDTRNGHLSLLFHAIILGNLAALQTLLEVGADPSKTNKRGINVLHLMAKRRQVVMSELCLKSIKNEDGKKGFVNNSSEIGWSVLIQASSITTDDVTYVAWLLDNGAALDHKMRSGWTAAHAAAYIGNIKVLSLLLNRGADINSVATKKDVPPFRNLKPRDVAKNDETRNLLDR